MTIKDGVPRSFVGCHVLCSLSISIVPISLLSLLLEDFISIVIAYDANKEGPKG